ncbi:NAD(P)-binding protein [Coniophora puteana RWD-64-598 SS2]|uniref:NAD(P)-binding protein n=1 Tax=Coniophora puteana (strain RWD-64-598) TaxID=741705 RepID=A0A5M3MPU1_CONPW|nr:NAD(P)-binding protein [Coniophora puteana RWD-64-598 SS2]EIW81198.1 NAD(P)-binding protein [Coniophora puteana RWD-64-598 SS2]
MKVLVTGATGFVGFPVCKALSRAGHIVYGAARTTEKAKELAAEEIIPVIGDSSDTSAFIALVPTLDVVIDVFAGADGTHGPLFRTVRASAQATRPPGAPKLAYIITGGTWVHGDDRKEVVSDTSPLANPIELTAWRVSVEREVLEDTVLKGIAVRPSLVYGRSGSLFSDLFRRASEAALQPGGRFVWPGSVGGRIATVHTDDLADLYVRVAERAQILGGLVFDGANQSTESVDDLLAKLVEVTGAHGFDYKEPSNAFERAIATTTLLRPYTGRALVDWVPRKASVVDGLTTYYAAWQANLGQGPKFENRDAK